MKTFWPLHATKIEEDNQIKRYEYLPTVCVGKYLIKYIAIEFIRRMELSVQ